MKAGIKFEPRDLWIGLYWTKCRTTTLDSDYTTTKLYICIIPCLPIMLGWNKNIKPSNRYINW